MNHSFTLTLFLDQHPHFKSKSRIEMVVVLGGTGRGWEIEEPVLETRFDSYSMSFFN